MERKIRFSVMDWIPYNPLGLTATTSGEKSGPQPFIGWGTTADSVKSFPENPNQMKDSDSDGSIVIEKRDLSPTMVRGFVSPNVNANRNESTMKFKEPKNYNPLLREPTICTWFEKIDMYLELSNCPEGQRISVTAMLLEGAAMTWYNGNRQQIRENLCVEWANYTEFRMELLQAFEPMSEVERARTTIRNLRQMGRVTGYIQKFRDLRFQIPDMGNVEAFSHFVAGLNPDIRTQIGIHVDQNDLNAAIVMAEKIACYQRVEARKTVQKGDQEMKTSVKMDRPNTGAQLNMVQGEASSSLGANGNPQKGERK